MPPIDITPIDIPHSRDFYLAYLRTPDWRVKRNRVLALATYRCEKCGEKRDLEVHHKTYERLSREWDQDLEVLCQGCHNGHHLKAAELTDLRVYLKLVRQVLGSDPFLSIADINADVKALCAKHHVPDDGRKVEKAVGLVLGRYPLQAEQEPLKMAEQKVEMVTYQPPCSCQLCRDAGVDDQRLRLDPYTGLWLHGEDLRRWYAAKDAFDQGARAAVGARGRHAAGFEPLAK
jgi:hypothetical protein